MTRRLAALAVQSRPGNLRNRQRRPAAAPPPPASAYSDDVLALSPDWYLRLAETGGSSANAEVGANGTYVNNPQLGVGPIVEDDDGYSVGFDGASQPSHLTASLPLSGASLTIDMAIQLDDLSIAKHVLITTTGGTVAGEFSVEVLTSGQVRAWSVDSGGTVREILGTVDDVVQGTACKLTYTRQSNVSGWCHRVLVDGSVVAEDTTQRTWAAVPAGTTVYVGTWRSGAGIYIAGMDGLMSHLAGWNSVVDVSTLGTSQSIAWAIDLDAGTVPVSDSTFISVTQGGWHGKNPIAVTAGDGALVTTTEDISQITITAGAVEGADSFTYYFTDANSNVSATKTVTVLVPHSSPSLSVWDLDEAFGATSAVDGGSNSNGTYVGKPQRGVPGIVSGGGDCLGLDGWRDYVQISHDSAFAITNGTISGYAQCHSLGWDQTIIRKGNVAITVTGLGHIRAEIGGTSLESTTDFAIDAGTAFFWAFTFGSGGAKLYLWSAGGSLSQVASNATTASMSANTGTMYFGTRPDGGYSHQLRFYGFLSQIQLFDEVLTSGDLAAFAAPVTADVYDTSLAFWGFALGQPICGSGAANNVVKTSSTGAYSFTAMRTGNIDKIRLSLRQGASGSGGENYSSGNGGVYLIELCPLDPSNDDPMPGSTLISSWAPGDLGYGSHALELSTTQRTTVRGRKYFIKFTNISTPSNTHWSSLNVNIHGCVAGSTDSVNLTRDAEDGVIGLCWFRGITLPSMWRTGNWRRTRLGHGLGFGVRYGSQSDWTLSSVEFGGRRSEDIDELYGSQRVGRIRFTAPATRQADGIWFCFHKWGSAGALSVVFKEGSTTLETISVSASSISLGTHLTAGPSKSGFGGTIEWVFAPFTALRTITSGQAYTIEFRSPTSTDGDNCILLSGMLGMQDTIGGGSGWVLSKECWKVVGGFGACDFSTNNGSSWVYFRHHSSSADSPFRDGEVELPVCLRYVPEI